MKRVTVVIAVLLLVLLTAAAPALAKKKHPQFRPVNAHRCGFYYIYYC
jgi:predicted S18 family serine protease